MTTESTTAVMELPTYPATDKETLEFMRMAREEGALLDAVRSEIPGATALLASDTLPEDRRIITTEEAQTPPGFWEFHRQAKTAGALGVLATNAVMALSDVEGFEGIEGEDIEQRMLRLTPKLLRTFGAITAFKTKEVDLKDKKIKNNEVVDGRVVFGVTKFKVNTHEEARHLSGVLGAWLTPEHAENAHSVYMNQNEDGSWTVEAHRIDEYNVRVTESALGELMARWLKKTTKTKFPKQKRALKHWKEEDYETFNPTAEELLNGIDQDYQDLIPSILEAEYAAEYSNAQPVIDAEPLGTTPAAIFEALRKVSNGLTRKMRNGHNQEQNPNKRQRLQIERHVNLKRDAPNPTTLAFGPADVHEANIREVAAESARERLEEVKQHPVRESAKTLAKLGAKAVGLGIESLADLALSASPWTKNKSLNLFKNYRAWRQQKKAAAAVGPRIDAAIDVLSRQIEQ